MKCDDYQHRVSIYVDEALGDAQSAEVFSHLSGCPDCRAFLRSTLDIRNAIAAAPRPRIPQTDRASAFAPAGVRGQTLRITPPMRRSLWSRHVSLPISAAATVIVALLASLVGLASFMIRSAEGEEAGRAQVVYMTKMPVVEVYATPPAQTVTPQ